MRGNRAFAKRSSRRAPLPPEETTRPVTIPAPYGGWNARGNLINMAPIEAYRLDNIFPGVQDVTLRRGSEDHVTGFADSVERLMVYNSGTLQKLFASTSAGIYDVSSAGAVGAAVIAGTSGRWKHINFTNSGGSYLFAVNGVDSPARYDGASWISITGAGTGAITGVTTSSLIDLAVHQRRLWFVEKQSMKLWYLAVDAIAGAATQFPVGAIFKQGGSIKTISTWTLDSGRGPDDYLVILTTEGEIAIYQGTDPASSSTWALVGVFSAYKPLGDRPLISYGGELLYLTYNGLFPISKFMSREGPKEDDAVSFLIDGAFADAADAYKGNYGWDMAQFPSGNFLLVNVPVSTEPQAYQFVMNTTTKRWCRFTEWNAACFAVFNDELYFGGVDAVVKAWTGQNDNGAAIQAYCGQAYNNFRIAGQKRVDLVRPNIGVSGTATLMMAMDTDFQLFSDQTSVAYSASSGIGIWDSSLWDSGIWSDSEVTVQPQWTTIPNNPGFLMSFRLQLTTSTASFSWAATNFAVSPMGLL